MVRPQAKTGPHNHLPPALAAAMEGYRKGAFLMAATSPRGRPGHPSSAPAWYETDPRGMIRLDPPGFHISRRLAQTMRSGRFEVTTDTAFARVIRACADPRRDGAWIDHHIIALFEAFHDAGLAHSVEAWRNGTPKARLGAGLGEGHSEPHPGAQRSASPPLSLPLPPNDTILYDPTHNRTLVGGLYGLRVGGVFCGEAMFSRPDLGGRDASKVCLARTILHCQARGFTLLDTQMWSEHLATFGCEQMSAAEYHKLLQKHRDDACEWGELSEPRA